MVSGEAVLEATGVVVNDLVVVVGGIGVENAMAIRVVADGLVVEVAF